MKISSSKRTNLNLASASALMSNIFETNNKLLDVAESVATAVSTKRTTTKRTDADADSAAKLRKPKEQHNYHCKHVQAIKKILSKNHANEAWFSSTAIFVFFSSPFKYYILFLWYIQYMMWVWIYHFIYNIYILFYDLSSDFWIRRETWYSIWFSSICWYISIIHRIVHLRKTYLSKLKNTIA